MIEPAPERMIGFAGICHPGWLPGWERSVEVGWRLRRSAWGHGYATEAGRAGLEHGFQDLGLREIVSLIHPHNLRSAAVAERLGLELSERLPHPQHPHDVLVYAGAAP